VQDITPEESSSDWVVVSIISHDMCTRDTH
jgi:hypothetical protein